jgi:hypothetical protein
MSASLATSTVTNMPHQYDLPHMLTWHVGHMCALIWSKSVGISILLKGLNLGNQKCYFENYGPKGLKLLYILNKSSMGQNTIWLIKYVTNYNW